MQEAPPVPPIPSIPSIPFDPNAVDWSAILGIGCGIILIIVAGMIILRWMSQKHEREKLKLELEAKRLAGTESAEAPVQVKRLQDRLENLEMLLCRLDAEMNQQLERSLSGGRLGIAGPQEGVSSMPTAFLNIASALEGRYQVLKELGRGGMGIVFQAHDKQLKEPVALKIVSPVLSTDPEALERLKREVSAARRISHPNVIRIYDIGENNGLHFVSMEFFPGSSLKEYVRRQGALSLMEGKQIALQICAGLEAAHGQGIVHRDLKSQNILVGPSGNVKIIDFGLARAGYFEGLTATGLILGTPEYMAPEQVAGKKTDERADIYSLGIILYELFTGRLPFRGESAISVGFQQMKDEPPSPQTLNSQIPDSLQSVILKALEKEPMRRYRSVAEMREDLERCAGAGPGVRVAESGKPPAHDVVKE